MSEKIVYNKAKVYSVYAYPYISNDSSKHSEGGYFGKIKSGVIVPESTEETLYDNLKKVSFLVINSHRLSYQYKEGDVTTFVVKYKPSPKSSVHEFVFTTGVGNVRL